MGKRRSYAANHPEQTVSVNAQMTELADLDAHELTRASRLF